MRAIAPPRAFTDDDTFESDFFGMRFRGRLNSYIDWTVFFYGSYESETLFLIRDILRGRPGAVMLDVGANVGVHSLYASQFAQVHAFEPYPPILAALRENVAINGARVQIHGFGLGERTETLPFTAPTGDNRAIGTFRHGCGTLSLPVVRGDEFCAPLPRVDLIKIDVEGFEASVLRGLRETISRWHPALICETWDGHVERLLPGYRIERLGPDMILAR